MYSIYFYEDRRGISPVYNFIHDLSQKPDKDSRINANKINDYIELLSRNGKAIGEPYVKHLDGDIWELRPIRNRILFASWTNNSFILLHYFMKKTQETPRRDIDQAKHNLEDMQERSEQQ
jgi:phage-related protein